MQSDFHYRRAVGDGRGITHRRDYRQISRHHSAERHLLAVARTELQFHWFLAEPHAFISHSVTSSERPVALEKQVFDVHQVETLVRQIKNIGVLSDSLRTHLANRRGGSSHSQHIVAVGAL